MSYVRSEFAVLKKRMEEKRKLIQVIVGPRQVGKTTVVRQYLEQYQSPYLFANADGIVGNSSTWIEKQWEIARIRLKKDNLPSFLLIFDEIQKIHNWSEIIKKEWDQDTLNNYPIQLLVLGSSRLLLTKGLTESLTGRFELIKMSHWSFREVNEAFGVSADEYAWFGAYPGAVHLLPDEERWKNYVTNSIIEPSISKDIFQMTRIDKPALLKNLFEMGCAWSGQILSYTKILGQLQDAGNTTTLAHYLHLLGEAGLLTGIEKYAQKTINRRSSSPKFLVNNTALFSAMSSLTFKKALSDSTGWGRVIESAVGAHFLNCAYKTNLKVYYWRQGDHEVDFVLEYQGKIIAIEVKSGKRTVNNGIEIFRKAFSPDKILLIENSGLSWREIVKFNPLELF